MQIQPTQQTQQAPAPMAAPSPAPSISTTYSRLDKNHLPVDTMVPLRLSETLERVTGTMKEAYTAAKDLSRDLGRTGLTLARGFQPVAILQAGDGVFELAKLVRENGKPIAVMNKYYAFATQTLQDFDWTDPRIQAIVSPDNGWSASPAS
ncbi:MAG: hypothetical protein JWM90_162 [Thermoleophilia bacterium]|nr:hypothetical protein [Thermoleophilia bacterium]